MTDQQIRSTQDISRPWTVVRILPDARYYPVAKFFNRCDAEDYLRLLHRFIPVSKFEIVFDNGAIASTSS